MAYLRPRFRRVHSCHYRSGCTIESPNAAGAAVGEAATTAVADAVKRNFPVDVVAAAFSMGTRSRLSCRGKKRI